MSSKSSSRSVRKSAISTISAVIITAVLIGSIVGGAGYVYSTQTDAIISELKSDNSRISTQVRTSQEETAKLNSQIGAIQDEGKQLKSQNKIFADDNSKLKSQLSSVSADLKAVADAAGIPLSNVEELKKLIEERKLIEASKQEGKVMIYTSLGAANIEPLIRVFESRYPLITVEITYGVTGGRVAGGSGALASRFINEFNKGVKSADILQLDSVGTRDIQQRQAELLAKYMSKDSGYVPVELKDTDGRWAAVNTALWTIAYNTKLVSKEEAPKSFTDLVNPKWKGKIAAADLKAVPSFIDRIKTMEKQYGEDFVRQLALQNIRYYPTFGELLGRLASGEFPILLVATPVLVDPLKTAGQPVEWVRTNDNVYFSTYGWVGIPSNAPHPNAAKLWMDFMFSKQGMQIQADGGSLPTMPGLRLPNPELTLQGKKLIPIDQLSDPERKTFLEKYIALSP